MVVKGCYSQLTLVLLGTAASDGREGREGERGLEGEGGGKGGTGEREHEGADSDEGSKCAVRQGAPLTGRGLAGERREGEAEAAMDEDEGGKGGEDVQRGQVKLLDEDAAAMVGESGRERGRESENGAEGSAKDTELSSWLCWPPALQALEAGGGEREEGGGKEKKGDESGVKCGKRRVLEVSLAVWKRRGRRCTEQLAGEMRAAAEGGVAQGGGEQAGVGEEEEVERGGGEREGKRVNHLAAELRHGAVDEEVEMCLSWLQHCLVEERDSGVMPAVSGR